MRRDRMYNVFGDMKRLAKQGKTVDYIKYYNIIINYNNIMKIMV